MFDTILQLLPTLYLLRRKIGGLIQRFPRKPLAIDEQKRNLVSKTAFAAKLTYTFVGTAGEACSQMSAWNLQFPSERLLTIPVNVSGKQFTQPDLVEQMVEILRETRLDPGSLGVEVTESVAMHDAERILGMDVVAEGVETAEQANQLTSLGCKYAQGYFYSKPLNRDSVEALLGARPRFSI